MAGQDDGKAVIHFARPRQRLARCVGANLAEAAQPLDLLRLQHREQLRASRLGE